MCSTELKLEKSFFVKYTWTRMSDRLRDRAWMVHVRTEFLVKDVVEYMLLKENGLKLNGYTDVRRGQLKDVSNEVACIQEEDFLEARKEIVTCCERMKTQYGQELEEMCKKLDVNDEQLHTNFIEILTAIWEEKSARNWGRFISMLVAAYYVSDKLYKDGAKDKIDSVIGWLTKYLKMNAVTWIEDRGGYAGVLYGTRLTLMSRSGTQPAVDDCRTGYMAKAGLFTMAALGLGAAVVVGTIVGR